MQDSKDKKGQQLPKQKRNKSKKNTHFCWLSSHDFAYFRLVVLLDCHFLSLHGPRHSPYSTILPLDVRPDDSFYISKAGFLLGKMLGEDGCFFWTKPWVFEKTWLGITIFQHDGLLMSYLSCWEAGYCFRDIQTLEFFLRIFPYMYIVFFDKS